MATVRHAMRPSALAVLSGGGPEAAALAARCRDTYLQHGFVHVPNFVDAAVVQPMVAECLASAASGATSFLSTESHNPYLADDDGALPPRHPRNRPVESSKTIVDYSRVDARSPLRQLYASPDLLALVRGIVGPGEPLYPSQCPISCAYYNVFSETHGLGWHFDNSEFGVNLVLQAAQGPGPSAGGEFEFHHNTRSEAEPWAFGRVEELLESGCPSSLPGVARAEGLGAGSLVVFSGRHSLHRVTPVLPGATAPRINVIFTFEKELSGMNSEYSLRKFFGRTEDDRQKALSEQAAAAAESKL